MIDSRHFHRRRALGALVLSIVCGAACARSAPDTESSPSNEQTVANATPADKSDPSSKEKGKDEAAHAFGGDGKKSAAPYPMASVGPAATTTTTTTPTMKPPSIDGSGASALDEQPILDPNGRYATTYRPGGGHLAAFEAAIAKGLVPVLEREIVSDVGGRYAPSFALGTGRVMGVRADLERTALPPSGGVVHLRIALESASEVPKTRPHLSVHLVLDISGSMQGPSIENARVAAQDLVDKLAPSDDFSLTTFSDSAQVLIADGVIGARKAEIKKTIAGIQAMGGTNIGEGLSLAYHQAELGSIPKDAMRVVLLLSDGQPTSGIRDAHQLAGLALDAFQLGVQTSSFGLGDSYDGALMSAIADEGAGGYYYLRDASAIAPALGTEIDKRLQPIATAVEVRLRLKPGIDLLRVYGSRKLTEAEAAIVRTQELAADQNAEKKDHIKKDRETDADGGLRFFIPAYAAGEGHSILLEVKVPAGFGKKDLGVVELKYKDELHKTNAIDELPVAVQFADSDAASAATIDASVARTVQGFSAGDALVSAAMKMAKGDRQGAVSILAEREALLRTAATTLKEPSFIAEADRLARLEEQANGKDAISDPMLMAMLLETAGSSRLR